MSETPKKIWVIRDKYVVQPEKVYEHTIPYIRADLVDELVTALKTAHCWTSREIHTQHTAPLIEGALSKLDFEDKK